MALNCLDILKYVEKQYGINPDYPFEKYPSYAALRHSGNKKWFGLLMYVPQKKLGLKNDEKIDILNVKCPLVKRDCLLQRAGFFPAYHMNKEHWITIALNQKNISKEEIYSLLDESYRLTQ